MTLPPHPDTPLRAPVSTYRLQFNHTFTFADATAILDYLAAIGVTECYASPLLTANPGSMHGYDICDHSRLNPELGSEEAFERFAATLGQHGLGLIVDFVPNHMGIDPETNAWWHDVLENGPSSPWATFFDIDWTPVKPELRDKVLLPILGEQYGVVLERGELQLQFVDGALRLSYFDRVLPINPRQATRVYRVGLDELRAEVGETDPHVRELMSIVTALVNLPPYTERDTEAIAERQREKEVARERLVRLVDGSPRIREHLERAVRTVNGTPGDRASFDQLHELLEHQAYRLAYWRTAFDEINYRRFFDVNQLAALRMEDRRVFDATHGLLLDLIGRGIVTGVRIDHPDGLFNPAVYFEALQRAAALVRHGGKDGDADRAPEAEGRPSSRDLYVVVEKILSHGESLPAWPVHGTTGYNALNALNGLFVHGRSLQTLQKAYRTFTGQREATADVVYTSKRAIMRTSLSSELNVLAHALNRISETDRRTRDFTLNTLRRALTEVVACFPVYRTYVTAAGGSEDDARIVDAAIAEARRRDPVMESSIFQFVRDILLPAGQDDDDSDAGRDARTHFAMKLQQYTGPVEAKGLEDTAFYRDVPLVSANEVGGDPHRRARTDADFHGENTIRRRDWPFEMTTTATHDTKRGEDTRLRIDVLAEVPATWARLVGRWAALNEKHRSTVSGQPAPDRNDEWLFYQSLIGVWPAESPDTALPGRAPEPLVSRITGYMVKAVKEAKRHTSWVNVNAAYDEAVVRFAREVLTSTSAARFLSSFVPFQREVAWFGMINSLAQVVLRMAGPGVPDVYQGTELWDLSLVDPDNRRPVDFAHRRALLAAMEPLLAGVDEVRAGRLEVVDDAARHALGGMLASWWDGRVKLLTMTAALRLRRSLPGVFLLGEYVPLASDSSDGHLVGFARRLEDTSVIAMAPRFLATRFNGTPRSPLGLQGWETHRIPLPAGMAQQTFVNVVTGEIVHPLAYRGSVWLLAADVFTTWPVALLVSI